MRIRRYFNLYNKIIFNLKKFSFNNKLKTLFCIASLAGFSNALANQINTSCEPPDAPYCWNGFYVGAELGWGWNQGNWDYTNPNFFNTLGRKLLGSNFHFNSNGVIGGGNLGYNYQTGPVVLGLEGSVLGADFSVDRASPFFPTDTYSSSMNLISMVKGRLGYAFHQWLVYLGGGWAGGDVSLALKASPEAVRASSKDWANGWTAGAGVDYRLNKCLSLGVAYDYIKLYLNSITVNCPACGTGVGLGTPIIDSHLNTQTVMGRLTYYIN